MEGAAQCVATERGGERQQGKEGAQKQNTCAKRNERENVEAPRGDGRRVLVPPLGGLRLEQLLPLSSRVRV